MPVVSSPRLSPRSQICHQAGAALPRCGLGPRPEDRHQLDPRAGLSRKYQPCYTTVAAAGKQADNIAARLVNEAVKPLVAGQTRLTLALDDTPTQRYGPYVQGAGIHHNPTPGPAGSPHVYGHVWVVLGLLAVHPAWGVIALPLLARLYVRAKDLPRIDPKHRPEFRTKLEMAVELLRWARFWLRFLGKPLWVVVDGAYAKAPFLKPAMSLGMTVVSRLRKDAALRTVPGPRAPRRRGRPRVYGESRIELAKRAGQRRGWTTGIFDLYGKRAKKRYKTFVATWQPASGAIRVVLVDEPSGWVASSAPTCRRPLPRSSRRSPTGSRWRSRSATARRSSEPANSRCGSCGQTSVHSTSASGRSR